jgi:putative hydrolase of the HAD superfamily
VQVYKAVVFDFGNVLCSVDRMAFARAVAPYSRLTPVELDSALWGGSLEKELETGKLDSHGYFSRLTDIAGLSPDYGYERFAKDFKLIIQPNPDGEEALKTVAELGLRSFVLSNTSFLHATMIFGNETLARIPEHHILSYKVGVMKPDPEIWKALLSCSGLHAEDCLYIDDVKAYCDAATSLGFGAFQYDKNVHNLSRILKNMLQ